MSHAPSKTGLADLLEASRRMQDCARTGDWESVDELQLQCHELSQDIFTAPVSPRESAAHAAAIKELLGINESIVSLGCNAREICLQNVGSLKHSRQAIKEYTTNSA